VAKGIATVASSLERLIKKEKISCRRPRRRAGTHQGQHQL
jgi:predicted transcriptional regulator